MQAYVTRRRWAIALVFFMAFAWTSAMFSYALAAEIYYTRCNANLRAEASSDSKSILIIRGGEKVSVSGKSGEWLRVVYGNRKGYIRADLLVQMTRSGYIPLAKGDESPQVKDLQKRLRVLDYLSIGADGEFGETTEQAVYDFQKRNRLDPDGIAGGQTQALLFSDKARSASGNSAGSSSSGGNQTALHGAVALRKGDKGSEVKVMQIRLKELGYLAFTPDSVFGGGTEKAVIAFQKKNGLTSDGLAGKGTLSVLYGNNARPTESTTQMPETAKTTLRRGDNGGEVRNMQVRLRELGYITFSPDSAFGSGTRNAVIAFQKANHLTADGIAGASTLAKMYSSSAVAKSSGSGGSSSSVSAPNGSNVRLLHWFNVVKKNYRSGQVITVYDPNSRLSWKIRLMSMGRHADSEPLSAEDTATMNSAFGNKTTWNPKAVWIKFPDGVWSMATMHNTPHLSGTIQNNNFDGHLCIHFLRDMDECRQNDPKYGVQNQEALRSAWKALTGETVP